jgi:hypothetical protein
MMTGSEAAQEAFEVPEVEWPQGLRGRVGTESLLYAFAVAKEVLQCGSDEAWYPATRHLQPVVYDQAQGRLDGGRGDGDRRGPGRSSSRRDYQSPRPRLLALLRASLMPRRVYLFNSFLLLSLP